MTAVLAPNAHLLASARWPSARESMTEPGLIVWRLAEDMADLFDQGAEADLEALAALGWPRALIAHYVEAARFHAAAIAAEKLFARRPPAAPIPLEPVVSNDNETAPPAERPDPRAFLFGIAGGALIGALLTCALFSFVEALR